MQRERTRSPFFTPYLVWVLKIAARSLMSALREKERSRRACTLRGLEMMIMIRYDHSFTPVNLINSLQASTCINVKMRA
jgi:hypothetical protein